jgi:hypothetical protein
LKYGEHRFNGRIVKPKHYKEWKKDKVYNRHTRKYEKGGEEDITEISIYGVSKKDGDYSIIDETFYVSGDVKESDIKSYLDSEKIWTVFNDSGKPSKKRITIAGQKIKRGDKKLIKDWKSHISKSISGLQYQADDKGHGRRRVRGIVESAKEENGVMQKLIEDFSGDYAGR